MKFSSFRLAFALYISFASFCAGSPSHPQERDTTVAGRGSSTPPTHSCTTTIEPDGSIRRHLEIQKLCSPQAKVIADQIVHRGNSSAISSSTLRVTVSVGSQELIRKRTSTHADGTGDGSIHWGPLISGAKTAKFSIRDGTISGSIDNRGFNPFSQGAAASSVTFADGKQSPVLKAAPQVQKALRGLDQVIHQALQSCEMHDSSSTVTAYRSPARVLSPLTPRANRLQDHGHFSDTYSTSSCDTCKGGATLAVVGGGVGCAVATCWWSLGIGCVVCTGGTVAAEVTAIAECEFSGACCPKACDRGSFPLDPPLCCFGDETCVGSSGRCCSAEKQPCGGLSCCDADQTCVRDGAQAGSCCPTESVCGSQCCSADTDVCINNTTCCSAEDACGSTCCNPPDAVDTNGHQLRLSFCVDKQKGICCLSGQVLIDGICCQPGQIVLNGKCCAAGSVSCNGQCCAGTCGSDGKCQIAITDDECTALGYFYGSCGTNPLVGKTINCSWCSDEGCCVAEPR